MKNKIYFGLIVIGFYLSLNSCKKAKEIEYQNSWNMANEEVFHIMKEWYYWDYTLPADADMSSYSTPQDAMNSLTYKTYDKWSFVITKEEYNNYFFGNSAIAYGFSIDENQKGQLAVSTISKNSPADQAGLKRGYIISRINGQNTSGIRDFSQFCPSTINESIRLDVVNDDGQTKHLTINAGYINIETVPVYKTINTANGKYGYIDIESFVEKTPSSIQEAFNYFKTENIKHLIIDLRNNGGGLLTGAEYLIEQLVPSTAKDMPMYSLKYNYAKSQSYKDVTYKIKSTSSMNLDQIFFLTSEYTASASEMVINCIEPYKHCVQIGGTTHGKPVGMSTFFYDDWAISPIMFSIYNKNGEGDYFSGIDPDVFVKANFNYELGDSSESLLNAALNYKTSATKSLAKFSPSRKVNFKGIRSIINFF